MTELHFQGFVSPAIGAVLLCLLSAITFVGYRRETRSLDSSAAWALPMLRTMTVITLLVVLLGPVLEFQKKIGTLGRVTFIVDPSSSMKRMDEGNMESREAQVKGLFAPDAPLGDRFRNEFDVRVIESETTTTTDIAGWIRSFLTQRDRDAETVQASLVEAPMETVVLFSDGQNNAGQSPIEIARDFAAAGIPLVCVGVGADNEPVDLAILAVNRPDQIGLDRSMAGSIQVKVQTDQPVPLELRIRSPEGDIAWQHDLTQENIENGMVPFQFDLQAKWIESAKKSPDLQQDILTLGFTAELASKTNLAEHDLENNSMNFVVSAINAVPRLLVVDGRSRWEFRYLRNLFQRDSHWDLTSCTVEEGINDGTSFLQAFPKSFEELLEYDLVVIGEVSDKLLDRTKQQWIRDYVDAGGGLILIDGNRGELRKLADQTMGDVIPVRWFGNQRGWPTDKWLLSETGESAAWLNLASEGISENEIWDSLPSPHSAQWVEAKQDAEILLRAQGDMRVMPMIIQRSFGGGRVLYLATDESWRWRFKRGDQVHARFWNQLATAWMIPPMAIQSAFAEFDAGKSQYDVGEKIALRAKLKNADGSPNSNATVEAVFKHDNQVVLTIPLALSDAKLGMYLGETSALPVGEFEVGIRANGYGEDLQRLNTPIHVVDAVSPESLSVVRNRELLRELAAAGNGQYFDLEDGAELLNYLRPRSSGRIERTFYSLWDSYYWFLPIIGLLATEWWLRKRVGLP
jgi:uncharacterized membrane protein